jgi:hypothetical protein
MIVAASNPVFGSRMCYDTGRVLVNLNKRDAATAAIAKQLSTLEQNYVTNVSQAEAVLWRLIIVGRRGHSPALRDLSSADLDTIVADAKLVVATLYIQSVVDFQRLLHLALAAENVLD